MFRYQLTIRPAAPENTPEGPGRRFTDENLPFFERRDHGSVYYSEPLSPQQIEHYSLIPVNECKALHGKTFSQSVGKKGDTATYTLEVDENAVITATGTYGELTQTDRMSYADILARISSGRWIESKP